MVEAPLCLALSAAEEAAREAIVKLFCSGAIRWDEEGREVVREGRGEKREKGMQSWRLGRWCGCSRVPTPRANPPE